MNDCATETPARGDAADLGHRDGVSAVIYLSWGTTYKVTGFAMQDETMPPALFGGIRLLLAGAILLALQGRAGNQSA